MSVNHDVVRRVPRVGLVAKVRARALEGVAMKAASLVCNMDILACRSGSAGGLAGRNYRDFDLKNGPF